jgi:hypothetical protein
MLHTGFKQHFGCHTSPAGCIAVIHAKTHDFEFLLACEEQRNSEGIIDVATEIAIEYHFLFLSIGGNMKET